MENTINVNSEPAEQKEKKREPRTIEQQLDELEKKRKEIIEKERRLKAKISAEERKKRTKRLIEVGATVESVLGLPIEKEDLPKLKNFLEAQEKRGGYFSAAMKK